MSTPDGGSPRSRSVLFLAGSLIGGNLLSAVFQMVGVVLVARLVAPATLGLFSGIALVLGYAALLQLGASHGLSRELPYLIGKGDRVQANELAAAAQAWALVVGGVVSVGLVGVGVWFVPHGEWWKAAGWLTHALLAALLFYTNYLQTTFRTSHDFVRLATANVIQQGVSLALVIAVAAFSFYGLCLRAFMAAAVGAAVL
ncbi:MAG: hypothetical protein JXA57_09290, partial [Armatimonadetes bacterium]|nr:hypothetical protein [Armatimonadota bacterium]